MTDYSIKLTASGEVAFSWLVKPPSDRYYNSFTMQGSPWQGSPAYGKAGRGDNCFSIRFGLARSSTWGVSINAPGWGSLNLSQFTHHRHIKVLFSGRGDGSWTTVQWSWYSLVGTSIILPCWSKPTLAIQSERLSSWQWGSDLRSIDC